MKEKEIIYQGEAYWPEEILHGLERQEIGGKCFPVYSQEPASMYESLLMAEKRWPGKVCLTDDDGTPFTYKQFLRLVDGFAVCLERKYRVKPGAHVGLLLYNSIEFCACSYALNRLRAVIVPFSTKYKETETRSLISMADLDGVIVHRDFSSWFQDGEIPFVIVLDREAVQSCESQASACEKLPSREDTAILMFTSGTTSRSKGALLSNYSVIHAIAVYRKIFRIGEKDSTVLPVPAYHITGLVAVIGLFISAGGCVRLHKYFQADRVLKEMKDYNLTFFHASPTAISLLLEKREAYPSLPYLRTMACGSGNMPQRKIQELKQWIPGLSFRTVYGLTETSSPATIFPGDAAEGKHTGSSGYVIPGMEFKICGSEGETVEPGETGTIFVRGTNVTTGYYGRDDLKLTDGWLDTGDVGRFDREGYLYILDRKKDMINRGGEKVCSYDVENVIYGIKGVKEVAVVAVPDEKYGEVPAAMIVPERDGMLSEENIRAYLKTRLAKFQIPAHIAFTGNLPMTANMKVDKNKVRSLLQGGGREER